MTLICDNDIVMQVKYCSENGKRLIHFSTCEVYGKTIGCYLPKDSPLRQVTRQPFDADLCSSSWPVLSHIPVTLAFL